MQVASQPVLSFTKSHVYCSIRNHHDAEDVHQDCLITFLEIKRTYKNKTQEEIDSIQKVACRNKVRDYVRRRSVRSKEIPSFFLWYQKDFAETPKDKILARVCLEDISSVAPDGSRQLLRVFLNSPTGTCTPEALSVSKKTYFRYMSKLKELVKMDVQEVVLRTRNTNYKS